MKTVRELLLKRHRGVTPRLDKIRTDLIGSLERQERSPLRMLRCSLRALAQQGLALPLPLRRGLPVAWLVAALLQGWVSWESRFDTLAATARSMRLSPGDWRERIEFRRWTTRELDELWLGGVSVPGFEPGPKTSPGEPLSHLPEQGNARVAQSSV